MNMKKIIVAAAIILVIGGFLIFQKLNTSQNSSEITIPTVTTPSGTTYKDGVYTGVVGSASQYGNVQVRVTIKDGKITDIEYLQFPTGGGHTAEVTAMAKPILKQEAIQAQSAKIDTVTGATQDTEGFIQSLQSALGQAKI